MAETDQDHPPLQTARWHESQKNPHQAKKLGQNAKARVGAIHDPCHPWVGVAPTKPYPKRSCCQGSCSRISTLQSSPSVYLIPLQ
jgi:hypothetical protein